MRQLSEERGNKFPKSLVPTSFKKGTPLTISVKDVYVLLTREGNFVECLNYSFQKNIYTLSEEHRVDRVSEPFLGRRQYF